MDYFEEFKRTRAELVGVTTQLVELKKQLEEMTVKYYEVKRQNEERAEIIRDLLAVLEIDSTQLREKLERWNNERNNQTRFSSLHLRVERQETYKVCGVLWYLWQPNCQGNK